MIYPEPDTIRRFLQEIVPEPPERSGLVRAAVLIPLIAGDREYSFLFTERSKAVEHHKGQISFPGGVCDPPEEDPVIAALREMEEEVGIPPACVCVMGTMNEFWTPTGFQITPVVGIIAKLPPLKIQQNEVASVFTVPFSFFSDPANVRVEQRVVEGTRREIYYYDYGSHTIWGATAMMLRGFLKTIRCLGQEML